MTIFTNLVPYTGFCVHSNKGKSADTCGDFYTCCDCGGNDNGGGCGCAYCWSCNRCEACAERELDYAVVSGELLVLETNSWDEAVKTRDQAIKEGLTNVKIIS